MMHDLPFVDAHVHLWDLKRIRYPWLTPPFGSDGPNGSVEAIARDYVLDDYRAESGHWNVAGMVHVEAGAVPAHSLLETAWLNDMAEAESLPSGLVAGAALDDPAVGHQLAAHARHKLVRGIRHIVNWHIDPRRSYTPRDLTGDDAWQAGFALLGKYGLSFDCQAYPGQFPTLARLFARHPEIQVIVNHAGMGVDDPAEWRLGMKLLAALPHVSTKISGLGFSVRPWNRARIESRVRETIDIFGTERAMFASDFPTDRLFASFDATLGTYAQAIHDLSEPERRALWGGNANRIYRLGLEL
jgi:predicted TIM-barrel fold metal-dependent hydrolase